MMGKRAAAPILALSTLVLASIAWATPAPARSPGRSAVGQALPGASLPYGETCASAGSLVGTLPQQINSSTRDSADDYDLSQAGTCAGGGTQHEDTGLGPDQVYQIATDVGCHLRINLQPVDSVDLALYVLSPECADVAGDCVAVDDGGGSGVAEDVELVTAASQTYYIIVDGFNGDSGSFDLTISETSTTGCRLVSPDPRASIGGRVWEDLNADGIQGAAEPGVGVVTVNLYDCSETPVHSTVSAIDDGTYLFSDLDPGGYLVEFILLAGHQFSPQDQGMDDALDSDAHPGTGRTVCTTLEPGENDQSWSAGMHQQQLLNLGDRVWHDTDRDGIQDPGETGVPGIGVDLYGNGACTGSPLVSDATDTAGGYGFSALAPGTYCLRFYDIPSLWHISPLNQGGDDTLDSDANDSGEIHNIVLTASDFDKDMGLYPGSYIYLPVVRR